MTECILFVEDDQLVQQLVIHELNKQDFTVVTHGNGTEAWEWLINGDTVPDACLFDIMLPGLDGFTLLNRVRDHSYFHNLPVLMLTAAGSEHDVMRALDQGADDYLTKPFRPPELSARLRRAL